MKNTSIEIKASIQRQTQQTEDHELITALQIKKGKYFCSILFLFSFSTLHPFQVGAESLKELIDVLPVATGTVIGVTKDGEMIVADTNLSSDPNDEFLFRQWALEINPRNMELLSFNRLVSCQIYYTSPRRVVGDCFIKVATGNSLPPIDHYMSVYANQSAIALDSSHFSMGTTGCSSEDRTNLPYLRFERREFVSCPETQIGSEE
jgi:hypothetical protein